MPARLRMLRALTLARFWKGLPIPERLLARVLGEGLGRVGVSAFSLAASDFSDDGHPFNVKLFEAKVIFRRRRSVSFCVVNRSQLLADCVKSLKRRIARNCHRRAPLVRKLLCPPDVLKETGPRQSRCPIRMFLWSSEGC